MIDKRQASEIPITHKAKRFNTPARNLSNRGDDATVAIRLYIVERQHIKSASNDFTCITF